MNKDLKTLFYTSAIFFAIVLYLGTMLLPTKREMGNLFFKNNDVKNANYYLNQQFLDDKNDVSNMKRYLLVLIEERKNKEIENIGDTFLKLHPENIEINQIMAKYCEDNMFFDKAEKYWKNIFLLDKQGKDVAVFEKLLNYYTFTKNYDEIINIYEHKNINGNASLDILYSLGQVYLQKMDIDNAEKVYNQILKNYPKETNVFSYLEYIYLFRGEKDKLLKNLRFKYEQTKDEYIFEKIISILIKAKDYEKVQLELENFLAKNPNNARIRDYYLVYLLDTKNYKQAISQASWLYKNTTEIKYLKNLYEIFYILKDYDSTIKFINEYNLKNASENDSYSSQILYDIYLNSKKDLNKAKDALYKVLEKDKTRLDDLKYLAELFNKKGDFQSAMNILEYYHVKKEGDYVSHNLLGDIYATLGYTDRSKDEYKRALKQLELQRK
jgi:tetratricopeptide (TPR) repeat protein